MHEWLAGVAHALQNNSFFLYLGSADHIYPFIQWTHFSGLSLWVSTCLILDLRLLGFGKEFQTPAKLLDTLIVWNWVGLGIAIVGGFTMFCIAATTYIDNPAFRVKIYMLLPVALILHIIVQAKTRAWGQTDETPPVAKLAGGVELLLWLSVMTAAIWIPNY
jgi:hypothetical protein